MTRPLDRHLDSGELDALISLQAPAVTVAGRLSEEAIREAQRHVESCQDCDRKVEMHRSLQSAFSLRTKIGQTAQGPSCSDESKWIRVAAGLLEEAETKELMKHAAQCGHCGLLLKKAVEVIAGEATPSEEELLSSLGSAQPEWRKNMAATLRDSMRVQQQKEGWWRPLFAWPTPAYAFAAVAFVGIVAWIGLQTFSSPSAEQLLAQAYSEHRTLEPRIEGAKYAPMRLQRGGGVSNLDKSPALLKAESLIGENLRQHPNDPTWLQARGRADLLDGNYDSAINSLQRALETEPNSPSLLTDLGSAYYLRAESTDRPTDYANAIESLAKALAKSPDDPIALFNQALACERMFLYTQAVDDWEHYLRLDPQGDWSNDARTRLAALRDKIRQHDKSQRQPLLTPHELAKEGPNAAAMEARIDERIEDYLHTAITEWLPQAFPVSHGQPSVEARAFLSNLASIMKDKHGDTWLEEVLRETTPAEFAAGVQSLAVSVSRNDEGDYSSARKAARKAALLFGASGNKAAELRAQAEEVYSDHLLWEGPSCLALLHKINRQLGTRHYSWISAQMSLEQSNCANLVGDLGTYQVAILRGLSQAESHNYPALRLRSLGFQSLSDSSLGDADAAFHHAVAGLAVFWPAQIDLMKGYNLYTDLDAAADGLHLPNTQVAISREATRLVEQQPDILLQAMAHRWYGYAAYLADMRGLAADEFAKASDRFRRSPRTVSTLRHYLNAELWLAKVEVRRGDLKGATARLQRAKPLLDAAPSFGLETDYYTAQADIALRTDDFAAAEPSIRSAVFLAEWALKSYPKESDRSQWADQTRSAYRNAVEWKLRHGEGNSALEIWEWYRGAELRADEASSLLSKAKRSIENPPEPSGAPPLPEPSVVANQLPLLREQTVVVYGTFNDGIAVWAYDDRGIFWRWVPTPLPPLEDMALRLQRLCSDPGSDLTTLRSTGRALYNVLIAPIEERLVPGRTIVFEPDDFLAVLPWEALVDSRGHFFVEHAPVVVAPNLYLAMRLRSTIAITPETPALIVSVPAVPLEHLPKLKDADDEANSVADRFTSPRRIRDSGATLSAIRREIRGAGVFHFAGHAIASPQRSGLALDEADPDTNRARLLDANSITAGEAKSLQLAVFSACPMQPNTGIGASGTESLAKSLLLAGTPHIIASRWDVDSRGTAEFMKQLYEILFSGKDIAHATHLARLTIAARPEFAHPYYWSAFELQGD